MNLRNAFIPFLLYFFILSPDFPLQSSCFRKMYISSIKPIYFRLIQPLLNSFKSYLIFQYCCVVFRRSPVIRLPNTKSNHRLFDPSRVTQISRRPRFFTHVIHYQWRSLAINIRRCQKKIHIKVFFNSRPP